MPLRADGGWAERGSATIGLVGLAGIAVFLGDDTTDNNDICQVAGPGARIAAVVPIAGMVMRTSVRRNTILLVS